MSSVVAPSAFSTSKITFSAVKSLESGGKQAYLNYSGNPLSIQLDKLETPFGLSTYDKSTPPKHSVDLKLRGYDDPTNNPKNALLFKVLSSLDEFMLDQAEKNAVAWFKGPKSRAVLSELYTPTVRFALDKEGNRKPYPPTVKANLRKKNDEFDVELYDENLKPMSGVPLEDVLVKGSVLTVLIQCTSVWFAGAKFGLSWKATQIRADKVPQNFRGKPAFLDDDGEPLSGGASTSVVASLGRTGLSGNGLSGNGLSGVGLSTGATSFAALHDEEDEEVNDEEALGKPQPPPSQEEEDEEAPLPVPPKKMTTTPAKVVKKIAKPSK